MFLRCLLKCASKAMPSGWDDHVILQGGSLSEAVGFVRLSVKGFESVHLGGRGWEG